MLPLITRINSDKILILISTFAVQKKIQPPLIMKRLYLITRLLLFFLPACGQNPDINQLSSHEFNSIINNGEGTLLDVRTKREFKNGHINNAGQLNYYAWEFRQKLLLLPKDEDIYLYCNTGYRSNRAARILLENGYSRVYNLQHGIMEWNLENLPVIVEPDARPDLDNKFEADQYNKLTNSDSLVFIDFYAPWCAPCRKMMPMIDSLKVEYHNRINIVKVNIDASKKLIKELKIVGVPYLVLYHKGDLLFSQNGIINRKEIEGIFDSQIKKSKAVNRG